MVDSRAKGARGEYLVRDMLREYTNLQFERVPNSGALEYLKGDLYIPHTKNKYCIEVKNYADSPLTDKMFTAPKTNNLIRWWNKLKIQAEQGDQEPLLFFKYNETVTSCNIHCHNYLVNTLFQKKYQFISTNSQLKVLRIQPQGEVACLFLRERFCSNDPKIRFPPSKIFAILFCDF